MKKKKLSFIDAKEMLSRAQMKTITAGSGDCQDKGEACHTQAEPNLNCCDGLVCAEHECMTPTR